MNTNEYGTREMKMQPPPEIVGGPEYETGLCDCWSHGSVCLLSTFCSPCIFNRTGAVFARPTNETIDTAKSEFFGAPCLTYYLIAACFGCVVSVYQGGQRGKYRARYGIDGNGCNDCLISCICQPCALAQDDLEVELRERRIQNWKDSQKQISGQMMQNFFFEQGEKIQEKTFGNF